MSQAPFAHPTDLFLLDELLSSNGKLTAQLDAVTSELKQLQKQQETLSLLRESQK